MGSSRRRPIIRSRSWRPAPSTFVVVVLVAITAALVPFRGPLDRAVPSVAAQDESGEADVIVVLRPRADPVAVARAAGVRPQRLYRNVFNGFSGRVPAQALQGLRRNPNVELVSPDLPIEIAATTLPSGIDRADADQNPWAGIAGEGGRVDADVAVLDTGIAAHADLDIAGGEGCVGTGGYGDAAGHGTHVAGTIGALDDGQGVVGVAPGARLWAVKVLGDNGSGSWSSVICGLDWVYANRETIDVVNMSLGGTGSDGACGEDALHLAICNVVAGGVPVVVAAGNDGRSAGGQVPATYDEVITVSAFADFDGRPGGGAQATCASGGRDDSFAGFSNYGADVDIAAPGVCIRSTVAGGGTGMMSGTSMAAPHVAGAAALYAANNPGATAADSRAWLLSEGSRTQGSSVGFGGDPDGSRERVLNLAVGDTTTQTPPAPAPGTRLVISGYAQSGNSNAGGLAGDGEVSTAWVTGTSNPPKTAWVRFELEASASLSEIQWQFKRTGFADRFRIQISDDGQAWRTIATRGNAKAGIQQTLPVTESARYVRFLFSNPNDDARLGYLAEVDIYGVVG